MMSWGDGTLADNLEVDFVPLNGSFATTVQETVMIRISESFNRTSTGQGGCAKYLTNRGSYYTIAYQQCGLPR